MKILSAAAGFTLVIALAGCSSSDQEKAKREAREDARKIADEAKKAGHEIKKDAKDLSRQANTAVQSGGNAEPEKMSQAEAKAKDAASHARIELDHAALLARVKARLASDAGLATLNHVTVAVDGSVVTLSGTAANESQKKAAEIAASQVQGVTQVQNRIAVQE